MIKGYFSWRKNIISGLFFILPIFISVAIAWWIFDLLTSGVADYVTTTYFENIDRPIFIFSLRVLSLFITLFTIYMVGLFTRNFFGKQIIGYWEGIIARIPIVRIIHGTVRQIMNTVLSGNNHMFSKVVLVEYPRRDVWVIGFLTAKGTKEINEAVNEDGLITVFVPTTPNPTSGFLIFIPQSDVKILDMSVTEGMQLVISGGAVKPEDSVKKVVQKNESDNSTE